MPVIFTLLAAVVAVTVGGVITTGAMTAFITLGAAIVITLGLTIVVNIMQGG